MNQFENYKDLNIHSSCRACLENVGKINNQHDIFATPGLQTKFTACSLMDAEPGDGLPTSLCLMCYKQINDFYNFQQKCIASRKLFQDCINLDKKLCSVEFAIDESKETLEQIVLNETKKETADDNPISLEIYSELIKEEPTVFETHFGYLLNDEVDSHSIGKSSDLNDEHDSSSHVSIQEQEDNEETKGDKQCEMTNSSSTKINLECVICKKSFKKNERFDAHMRVHRGLKAFPCNLCDKSYARRSRLKLHIKEKHEGRPKEKFPCTEPNCNSIMSTKQTLTQHIRDIHLNNGNQPKQLYICEECGKVLSSLTSLKNHKYLHNGEQLPYACPQCQKRYMTKNKLQVHMNRHAGIKKYTCSQCGAKKVTHNDLQKHIRTHTKQTKYPCQFCDLIFYSVWNFNRHKRIVHEGIKDFQCSYCDKSFGKAETKKHHEMTHTGEKPHECNICHKKFIQPTALKKHKNVHLKQLKSQEK